MTGRTACVLVAVTLAGCHWLLAYQPADRGVDGQSDGPRPPLDRFIALEGPTPVLDRASRELPRDGKPPDARTPDLPRIPDAGCPSGQIPCGAVCVNPQTSFQNCGGCGAPCSAAVADACKGGKCACGTGPACTGGLSCVGGACACVPGGACTGCCAPNGACLALATQSVTVCGKNGAACQGCDDGNPCTADSCSAGMCAHVATTIICDDGDPCTDADKCAGGSCTGTPRDCSAMATGTECQVGACDTAGVCVAVPAPNGGSCSQSGAIGKCCVGVCMPSWYPCP
jgi:hypothetical protein